MIRVFRPPAPAGFEHHPLRKHQQSQISEWFTRPLGQRGERGYAERWANYIPGFMGKLRELFSNNCAYCETRLDCEPDDVVLAFFRPTDGANQANGLVDLDHYWWLSWEWSNLYLACPTCIGEKGQKFPTKKPRAQVGTFGFALGAEKPLLLDPCLDDPSEHLTFIESGEVIALEGSERGKGTIEILNLNRNELVVARAESLRKTSDLLFDSNKLDSNFPELIFRCGRSQPYAGMTRQLVRGWLERISLSEAIGRELHSVLSDPEAGETNQPEKRERSERADLIDDYFSLGDKLREQTLHRAFLSIDLVGATKMKDGQDPLAVEFSFRKYHSFLESILQRHEMTQSTWAGDGSMSSFKESQYAVDAAVDFLGKLTNFNREHNRLPVPFRPRCGVHSGDIHADEFTPIERIISRVIDIAGHLQKEAEPNTLLISETTLTEISNKADFSQTKKVIDGQPVFKREETEGEPDQE